MKKVSRPKMRRIMVSMPPEMYADFKEKADQSGLSMSRVIYLRLKNRGNMVLVPHLLFQAVQHLVEVYERIVSTGVLSEADRQILQRVVEFEADLVAFQEDVTVVHGKDVKK